MLARWFRLGMIAPLYPGQQFLEESTGAFAELNSKNTFQTGVPMGKSSLSVREHLPPNPGVKLPATTLWCNAASEKDGSDGLELRHDRHKRDNSG